MSTRKLEVLATGALALVEDLGRPGLAASGVGRSGAADRSALRLANRLVANPEDAAGIEVVFGGLAVRASPGNRLALTVALSGAPAPADVDGAPVGHHALVTVRPGQVLRLGTPPTGLRTYLAVRGGITVDPVLGSRSTDVLAGLGPPKLEPGQVLPVGPEPSELPLVDVAPVPVPPGGEPVLFLADHPVTGGYPVGAVVLDADVDRAAQVRPGQAVRFVLVPPPWKDED